MTFSEFANALSPVCKDEKRGGDYVIKLVDKIMGGRPGRAHKDGSYQNPLRGKDDRLLQLILEGKRNISQSDASRILSSIDKYKFGEYIRSHCSEDAQKKLFENISEKENINGNDHVADICADLFEKILYNLASKE